jgi:hypothetical protein
VPSVNRRTFEATGLHESMAPIIPAVGVPLTSEDTAAWHSVKSHDVSIDDPPNALLLAAARLS